MTHTFNADINDSHMFNTDMSDSHMFNTDINNSRMFNARLNDQPFKCYMFSQFKAQNRNCRRQFIWMCIRSNARTLEGTNFQCSDMHLFYKRFGHINLFVCCCFKIKTFVFKSAA